jgi:RNA polymerase sigma-70 factor (ECF subfamily)
MTEFTDEELVIRFQDGSDQAFNVLVLRYQKKVYWIARRFVNDHDRADDITQEVFCRVFDGLKEFRSESSLYTWLYRITVNLSINALRRQRIRDLFRIDDFFELEDEHSVRPDVQAESGEQRTLIEAAIQTLPEKQKAVFLMRYYDELPYEEISKITKTSVGGLKANYFHAVKKIGDFLKNAHGTR